MNFELIIGYLIILIVCVSFVMFFAFICRLSISVRFKWHKFIEVHGLRWVFIISISAQFAFDVFVSTFLIFPNAIARTNAKLFNISTCIIVVVLKRFDIKLLAINYVCFNEKTILLWDFPKCSFVALFPHFWAFAANSQTNYRSENNNPRMKRLDLTANMNLVIRNKPEYKSVQFFVLTIFSLHDLDTDFLVVEPANPWAFA